MSELNHLQVSPTLTGWLPPCTGRRPIAYPISRFSSRMSTSSGCWDEKRATPLAWEVIQPKVPRRERVCGRCMPETTLSFAR